MSNDSFDQEFVVPMPNEEVLKASAKFAGMDVETYKKFYSLITGCSFYEKNEEE